jgi:hypothetical protein
MPPARNEVPYRKPNARLVRMLPMPTRHAPIKKSRYSMLSARITFILLAKGKNLHDLVQTGAGPEEDESNGAPWVRSQVTVDNIIAKDPSYTHRSGEYENNG